MLLELGLYLAGGIVVRVVIGVARVGRHVSVMRMRMRMLTSLVSVERPNGRLFVGAGDLRVAGSRRVGRVVDRVRQVVHVARALVHVAEEVAQTGGRACVGTANLLLLLLLHA